MPAKEKKGKKQENENTNVVKKENLNKEYYNLFLSKLYDLYNNFIELF